MPTCASCGVSYHNFHGPHKCPAPVTNTMGWGQPFGNANRPARFIASQGLPPRYRTGVLSEPEPPEAA